MSASEPIIVNQWERKAASDLGRQAFRVGQKAEVNEIETSLAMQTQEENERQTKG